MNTPVETVIDDTIASISGELRKISLQVLSPVLRRLRPRKRKLMA